MGVAVLALCLDAGGRVLDAEFLEANPAFSRQTGLGPVVGRRLGELLGVHATPWLAVLAEADASAQPMQGELPALTGGMWHLVQLARVGAPGQHRIAVALMDITRRRQIESALAESESRFGALADALPMPVWVIDQAGGLGFVNQAFQAFFGRLREEVKARELIHPDDLATFRFELRMALHEHRSMHVLVRGRRQDGSWRWLEMDGSPRHADNGRFIGLAGCCLDVTERREIEMAREQLLESERTARTVAEGMARLKDEFLANLSHELRTPLTTILGWSDLLLQRVGEDDPSRKGLVAIAASARSQRRLISDMLDLSAMLLGKVRPELAVLDLSAQLREAVAAQAEPACRGGQQLSLAGADAVRPVLADAARLQQVFANLLSNALKFTPAGGHVEVAVDDEDGGYRVAVRDDGDGISAEFLPHLFSRFRQADGSSTRRHGGLGLGLAIVQQLVEMHGGRVDAYSAGSGQGATFVVHLPAHDGTPTADVGPDEPVAGEEVLPLRGLRLLVVDDQPDVRDYLCQMLEGQGARVSAAGSATEALALLGDGRQHFDLLATDIGMPGMDGYGLIRTVREELALSPAELPALAVTALARRQDRERALASGFQGYVAKPYSITQLVAALRAAAQCAPRACVTGPRED